MTDKQQQTVVQLTAQQVVDEINRRGAEIVRLQPFLKNRDSAS